VFPLQRKNKVVAANTVNANASQIEKRRKEKEK
jgi:hypothetical protein